MSMGLIDQLAEDGVEKMIDRADKQLYRAKHNGRNRVLGANLREPQANKPIDSHQTACQSTGTDSR